MKKTFALITGFIITLMIGVAYGQTNYTITVSTNVRQEAALTKIVATINAQRAAETPPRGPVSNQQYLTSVVNDALRSYRQQYEDNAGDDIKKALPGATDAQLAQIKTILGLQ